MTAVPSTRVNSLEPAQNASSVASSDVSAAAAGDTPALPAKKSSKRTIGLGVLLLVAAGGAAYYQHVRYLESTDDAQVDAEVVAVPARTSGTVSKLLFVENQTVKAGDVLAQLDDEAPKARLAQAEASLEAAQAAAAAADADLDLTITNASGNKAAADATLGGAFAGVASASDQIREAEAAAKAAEASQKQAKIDRDRAAELTASGAFSKANLEQAETALSLANANADAARARALSLKSSASQATSRVAEARARAAQSGNVTAQVAQATARAKAAHAQVSMAQATRDLAALDLSYTRILAPHDGVVSKKSLAEGQNVSAGQTIVQLVTPGVWITANFKETQLERMKVGQPVTFSVDAFPSATLKGEVESFSGGTGSRFTLLPPDNATGNFTKIVQRVPVRIRVVDVPSSVALRPGMSVDTHVNTR